MSRAKMVSIKSDIIRKELREGGVLLRDAARALGISAPYFCRALREERLSQALLYRLADFLYKDPSDLTEDRLDTSERFQAHKWIPCSERLPEAKGHKPYLITEAHYDPECIGRFVEIDWYDARDDERVPSWDDHEEKDGIRVVAWMPLPEPYEGGGA